MKRKKGTGIIIAIVYIILGMFLLCRPGTSIKLVCRLIGVVSLVFGAVRMILGLKNKGEMLSYKSDFVIGILFLALGVYCLLFPQFLVSFVPLMAGIMLLLDGIGKVQHALDIRALDYMSWTGPLIYAIIILVLGVLLIINPFGAVTLAVRIFGIFLLVDGVGDVLIWAQIKA